MKLTFYFKPVTEVPNIVFFITVYVHTADPDRIE